MKTKRVKKPRYRRSILFLCYLTGVFDCWFKRNKGEVEDASFIAKRIAAFTDYTAYTMKKLETDTESTRSEAQIIMSSLDGSDAVNGKSIGQKRARKLMEERKAQESLLPYMDKLKAQTIAYAHGFKKPIADALLTALYSIEQNSAYIAYQKTNAVTDKAIHVKAKGFARIKEED